MARTTRCGAMPSPCAIVARIRHSSGDFALRGHSSASERRRPSAGRRRARLSFTCDRGLLRGSADHHQSDVRHGSAGHRRMRRRSWDRIRSSKDRECSTRSHSRSSACPGGSANAHDGANTRHGDSEPVRRRRFAALVVRRDCRLARRTLDLPAIPHQAEARLKTAIWTVSS